VFIRASVADFPLPDPSDRHHLIAPAIGQSSRAAMTSAEIREAFIEMRV
jgi:hypothetical protein